MNVLCAQTKAPGLRRRALAAGGRIEPQLLQGQPLNDGKEKMRGLAGAILAMAAGFSYAIEVELSTEVQTHSRPTIQGTTNLSLD